jgi:hypothetical protein
VRSLLLVAVQRCSRRVEGRRVEGGLRRGGGGGGAVG